MRLSLLRLPCLAAFALLLSGCAAHLLPLPDGAPRRATKAKLDLSQPICIGAVQFLTSPALNHINEIYELNDALNSKCSINGAPADEELRAMLATALSSQLNSEISAELPPSPRTSAIFRGTHCSKKGLRIQTALLSYDCGSEVSDGTTWMPLALYWQRTAYTPVSIQLGVNVIDEQSDRVLYSFTAVGEFEQTLSESTYLFGIFRYRTTGGAPISEAFRQALNRSAEEIARWAESNPGAL